MAEHVNIPWADRHPARLRSGLASARPATPDGIGDAYYSTDTNVLNLADTAGTAWEQFDLSAIGAAGTFAALTDTNFTSLQDNDIATYDTGSGKWINEAAGAGGGINQQVYVTGIDSAPVSVADTNSYTLQFDTQVRDTAAFWSTGDRGLIDIPSAGFYTVKVWVNLTWDTSPDGIAQLYAYESANGTFGAIGIDVPVITASVSTAVHLALSFDYQAATGDTIYFDIINDSGDAFTVDNGAVSVIRWGD